MKLASSLFLDRTTARSAGLLFTGESKGRLGFVCFEAGCGAEGADEGRANRGGAGISRSVGGGFGPRDWSCGEEEDKGIATAESREIRVFDELARALTECLTKVSSSHCATIFL